MRLLGMVESLSISTQEALGGLETRLLTLEAKMCSGLPGGGIHLACNVLIFVFEFKLLGTHGECSGLAWGGWL